MDNLKRQKVIRNFISDNNVFIIYLIVFLSCFFLVFLLLVNFFVVFLLLFLFLYLLLLLFYVVERMYISELKTVITFWM